MRNLLFFLFFKLLVVSFSKKKKNIQNCYREVLGREGFLTLLNQEVNCFSDRERSILLKVTTSIRKFFLEYYKESVSNAVFSTSCVSNVCFSTEYIYRRNVFFGRLHPISKGTEKILNFFKAVGFTFVVGKEVEITSYNFDALNMGKNHPAQSSSDTFYIENNIVLRTHTSAVQIREMGKMKPPLGLFTVGKVYRKDYDATHTPMFFQVEGLLVQENVSLGSLLCILIKFLNFFFEQNATKLRIRPSYFPFTEPSVEIDIMCFFCGNTYLVNKCSCCAGSGWVEVLGAGMVHVKVLENCNICSDKYNGFAFGLGVDRLVALYYKITDIRLNFSNDLRYLEQF